MNCLVCSVLRRVGDQHRWLNSFFTAAETSVFKGAICMLTAANCSWAHVVSCAASGAFSWLCPDWHSGKGGFHAAEHVGTQPDCQRGAALECTSQSQVSGSRNRAQLPLSEPRPAERRRPVWWQGAGSRLQPGLWLPGWWNSIVWDSKRLI